MMIPRNKKIILILLCISGFFLYQKFSNKKPAYYSFSVEKSDDFKNSPHDSTQPESLLVTQKSGILVVGSENKSKKRNWIVRKSIDQGKTWFTVDEFEGQSNSYNEARLVSEISKEHKLSVEGFSLDPKEKKSFWIKRESLDGGHAWKTTSSYEEKYFQVYQGTNLITHPKMGTLFVGQESVSNEEHQWAVYRVKRFQTSPEVLDQYRLEDLKHSAAKVILVDSFDNIFVAGMSRDHLDRHHWIVRFSSDQGKHWRTIDDHNGNLGAIVVSGGVQKYPRAVFFTGYEKESDGTFRWITRKIKY